MIDRVTLQTNEHANAVRLRGATLAAFMLCAAFAFLATGCGTVKPMPPAVRKSLMRADTVYVLPSIARYSTKGLVFNRTDSLRTERLRARLDSMLLPELARLLPGTVVMAGDSSDPKVRESMRVRLRAKAFRRTLPRQALSDVSDVVLMIPTFGRNMATPILPASTLRLEVTGPVKRRRKTMHHEDEVDAEDPAQLLFQVRKVLDPDYRG